MANTSQPQMSLLHLILISESFERLPDITITDDSKVKHATNYDISTLQNGDIHSVFLTVEYIIDYDNSRIVTIKIVYCGNFKQIGDHTQQELDSFLNVNAPAIIFPFVREIIASVTTRAMIGTILIQPVNFVQLYTKKKNQEK